MQSLRDSDIPAPPAGTKSVLELEAGSGICLVLENQTRN